jgi:hypothetical protein
LDPEWLREHIDSETHNQALARDAWAKYCEKHPAQSLDKDDWDRCYLPDQYDHRELPVPNFPLVVDFDHFARRISAQRSHFILLGMGYDFFAGLLQKPDSRLEAIAVDKGSVADLRVQLRDAGVTESVIYPDLDGLGRELKQLWAERLREPV